MTAIPAAGEAADTNVVYAATALDASGVPEAEPAFEAGASEGTSTILPAGQWLVTAEDVDGHHAEVRIELRAGEEKTLSLALE